MQINSYEILWISKNKKWQIRHKHDHAGGISVWLKNKYGWYEQVTPFDVYIPKYVEEAWSREYYKAKG